jgi:SAM-dependent methyltransferase
MDRVHRRTFLRILAAALAYAGAGTRAARAGDEAAPSNFKAIYSNSQLRERFYLFLKNVFHLYPEEGFHQLIVDATAAGGSDREIYETVQKRLPDIEPRLSKLTYALPALAKQKEEMTRETADLLGRMGAVKGYVEIGTPGRYVKGLRKRFAIEGTVYLVNDRAPALSMEDVVERGQITRAGKFVPLGDYDPFAAVRVPNSSVDLVTNYIGFHHPPADRLDPFVRSIAQVLRPGGRLVVRDHDVDGADMNAMVGLAHDVFNAGVGLSWAENHAQIRNFTSAPELTRYLEARGFSRSPGAGLQPGDPTKNTLMLFLKRA